MTRLLRKSIVFFIVLVSLTCPLLPEEVNRNEILHNSFYNSEMARRDRDNQHSESLKISARKSNLVRLAGLLQQKNYISGNAVVGDSSVVSFTDIKGIVSENKVEINGNNAFVKLGNRVHQIPVSLLYESDFSKKVYTLKKNDRRNIENAVADSFNRYGITPAKVVFSGGGPGRSKILVFKSQFANTTWDYSEFPLITIPGLFKLDREPSLFAFVYLPKVADKN